MANPVIEKINAELSELSQQLDQFKGTIQYLDGAKTEVQKSIQTVNHAEEHFNKKVEELKGTYQSFLKLDTAITNLIVEISEVDFPKRLDMIENTVKSTIQHLEQTKQATLDEVKNASEIIIDADFEGKFHQLQKLIDTSIHSNNTIINTIKSQKLPDKIRELQKSVNSKLDSSIFELKENTNQVATNTANSILKLNLPTKFEKLDASISGMMTCIQTTQERIESVERSVENNIDSSTKDIISTITSLHTELHSQNEKFQNTVIKNQKKADILNIIIIALIIIGTVINILL